MSDNLRLLPEETEQRLKKVRSNRAPKKIFGEGRDCRLRTITQKELPAPEEVCHKSIKTIEKP